MLVYYLADLPRHGGEPVSSFTVAIFTASFFAAELILSPLFGPLADRFGYHRIMQLGPAFGVAAVVLTGITTNLWLLGGTRWLEGASTAASVPSILGFIAIATMGDEGLRGKAVARFEAATLAGLGAGIVAAGPLWTIFHREAFFINAIIYVISWAIYHFGVGDPRADHGGHEHERRTSLSRYLEILSGAHVWLLAPTWIAVNAAIGLWTSQSIFQLVRPRDPRFIEQRLMSGASPLLVSAGLAVGMLVFLAGATPAALGLLADMSEPYPQDRGAIMGLYSVFLALGQITGSIAGGAAAEAAGIDGLLVATLVMLAIAVLPLWRLRAVEHHLGVAGRLEPVPDA